MNAVAAGIIIAAFLSHFGLRLAIYNRVNALGWRRRTIKRIVKATFAETWVTAASVAWIEFDSLSRIVHGEASFGVLPWSLLLYGIVCLAVGSVLGTLWLLWRPLWGLQQVHVDRKVQVIRGDARRVHAFARTRQCRLAAHIPGNQIFDLAVERIELPIASLPNSLDGYRIAHLSDVHFTGHFHPDYIADVLDHANAFEPDMMALTGDIADVPECIDWLPDLFSDSSSKDGCHFILGNHDTRISDPDDVRRAMQKAGWNDLGGRCESRRLRGTRVLLIGNETPWFDRPSDEELAAGKDDDEETDVFRLCLSHSPDQFDWGRRHRIDLMLCGHTHGGQGRLPLAGPILSPSWHGSRWASGDFYRAPTTMHVSRGLGGVHLLRWNCRPELSLITLRK
ncbi:metallophosphoesterase [Neorhodopirellula pilleata]|uniref:Phosphodiesterase YaeI n=1 Tax=Neorhodopirellula pilleata TaxID=2714738 RepID=A0A5C6A158_9BACT|nr:metallophosphoesterase [Neorhodopirellula pilleata]TWT93564.1 phosphodiesterase YaeI [Neorhodopirellula pilleata]